jgi:5-methylcytosine-specific restriction endonuclease McrA
MTRRYPVIAHRCPNCRQYRNVVETKSCCGITLLDVCENRDEIIAWLEKTEQRQQKYKTVVSEVTMKHRNEPVTMVKQVLNKKKWRKNPSDKTRALVLERDNHRCVECGCKDELHLHHIHRLSDGGNNDPDNLMTLCYVCHMGKHKDEPAYVLMLGNFFR